MAERFTHITLKKQDHYEFTHTIRLQPRDINYAGHLGNDSLISILGTARAEFFHALGLSETNLGDKETGVIIYDFSINYLSEAFMFDEVSIDIHLGELNKRGFRLYYRARVGQRLVAYAESGFLFFNYLKRKVSFIPDDFKMKIKQMVST